MSFRGFEGPAGTGKTHHLIESVLTRVAERPLQPHQQVLALTFMHGSRRRLEEKLAYTTLRGRYSSMTLDSFAVSLAQRWKSLCTALGIAPGDFDENCRCAGRLLEEPMVARWVAATFPIVLVDEAQELSPPRLRMVKALVPYLDLFMAADEFQCLDTGVDTRPFLEWFRTGHITTLNQVRRTNRSGLLEAAVALRAGAAPQRSGPGFEITYQFKNMVSFKLGHLLHRFRPQGSVALIVAPGGRNWINSMLPDLQAGFRSVRQTIAPLRIGWEASADEDISGATAALRQFDVTTTKGAVAALEAVTPRPAWLDSVIKVVVHQARACGQSVWSAAELEQLMRRSAANHRAYGTAK